MRWVPAVAGALVLLSAAAVAVGAALIYLPAGLIVAGLEGIAAAWVAVYVWARQSEREQAKRPGRT